MRHLRKHLDDYHSKFTHFRRVSSSVWRKSARKFTPGCVVSQHVIFFNDTAILRSIPLRGLTIKTNKRPPKPL